MQLATTSNVLLLFITCSSHLLVDSVSGYAIDDSGSSSGSSVSRNAARDYAAPPLPPLPQPHDHPTKEDLFDLDWDQVDERYDPRLLSEDLINESQSEADRKDDSRRRQAEHCYFEASRYEHGQKIPRPNPCEACICVDGETFCWWKQCGEPLKKAAAMTTTTKARKKAKLFTKPFSATTGGGGSNGGGGKTTGSVHRHHPSWSSSSGTAAVSSVTSSLSGSKKLPLNILNFPHNLPVHLSEIDLMIESDGVTRSTPKLPAVAPETTTNIIPTTPSTAAAGNNDRALETANGPRTPVPVTATASTTNYGDETESNDDNKLSTSSSSTTSTSRNGNNENVAPPYPQASSSSSPTAAINRNLSPQLSSPVLGAAVKDQLNPGTMSDKDEQLSAHQMTEKDINDNKRVPRVDNDSDTITGGNGKRLFSSPSAANAAAALTSTLTQTTTTTTTHPIPAVFQQWEDEREVDIDGAADEDFIRKISIDDDSPLAKHYIITSSGDIENIPLANQHLVSQFRENFINEIMPLNSVEKAVKVDMPPPTLILDTYPSPPMATRPYRSSGIAAVESTAPIAARDDNFSSTVASGGGGSSSSYATKIFIPSDGLAPSEPTNRKQQAQKNGQESAQVWNGGGSSISNKESAAVAASKANSNNNKSRDPVCIVMGQTYKVGMVLPQEVGNCLQCVCIEGPSAEEPARVICSPHNCPPLILPDLFDTTGY